MKFTAAACLAATASASTFEPKNWAKIYPVFMKNGFAATEPSNLELGTIVWSQCADPVGVFTLDTQGTSVSPYPCKKGNTESFDMKGSVSAAVNIAEYDINVKWNGHNLISETKAGAAFSAGPWEFKMSEKFPGLSPSGTYTIKA